MFQFFLGVRFTCNTCPEGLAGMSASNILRLSNTFSGQGSDFYAIPSNDMHQLGKLGKFIWNTTTGQPTEEEKKIETLLKVLRKEVAQRQAIQQQLNLTDKNNSETIAQLQAKNEELKKNILQNVADVKAEQQKLEDRGNDDLEKPPSSPADAPAVSEEVAKGSGPTASEDDDGSVIDEELEAEFAEENEEVAEMKTVVAKRVVEQKDPNAPAGGAPAAAGGAPPPPPSGAATGVPPGPPGGGVPPGLPGGGVPPPPPGGLGGVPPPPPGGPGVVPQKKPEQNKSEYLTYSFGASVGMIHKDKDGKFVSNDNKGTYAENVKSLEVQDDVFEEMKENVTKRAVSKLKPAVPKMKKTKKEEPKLKCVKNPLEVGIALSALRNDHRFPNSLNDLTMTVDLAEQLFNLNTKISSSKMRADTKDNIYDESCDQFKNRVMRIPHYAQKLGIVLKLRDFEFELKNISEGLQKKVINVTRKMKEDEILKSILRGLLKLYNATLKQDSPNATIMDFESFKNLRREYSSAIATLILKSNAPGDMKQKLRDLEKYSNEQKETIIEDFENAVKKQSEVRKSILGYIQTIKKGPGDRWDDEGKKLDGKLTEEEKKVRETLLECLEKIESEKLDQKSIDELKRLLKDGKNGANDMFNYFSFYRTKPSSDERTWAMFFAVLEGFISNILKVIRDDEEKQKPRNVPSLKDKVLKMGRAMRG